MLGVPLRSCKSLSYLPGLLQSDLAGWHERAERQCRWQHTRSTGPSLGWRVSDGFIPGTSSWVEAVGTPWWSTVRQRARCAAPQFQELHSHRGSSWAGCGECSESELGEEVLLGQGKLQSSGPSGALTTQKGKKGEEGVLWAPSGSTGSWGTHWTRRGGFSGTGSLPPRLPGGRGFTVSSDSPQSGEGSCGRMVWTGGREREKGEERKTGKSEVKRKLGDTQEMPLSLRDGSCRTGPPPVSDMPLLPQLRGSPPWIWLLPPTRTVSCHALPDAPTHLQCLLYFAPGLKPPSPFLTLTVRGFLDPPTPITWCGGAGQGWLQGRWPAEGGQ